MLRGVQLLILMDAFSPAAPLTARDKVLSLEVDTAVAAAAVIGALLISAFSAPMTRGRLKIRHLDAAKSLGRMAAWWAAADTRSGRQNSLADSPAQAPADLSR